VSFPEFVGDDSSGDGTGISGVAVGIVSDNRDPEGQGRVKLTFPWREKRDESHWARIAVPMAGSEVGTYFLPEVDDEVLVAFENGDIHYPFVVGALWNGQEPPPTSNESGSNDVRMIRTRSGHEVVLDDTEGAEAVEIRTGGGHLLRLDDATGGETITITDTSEQNSVTFDSTAGTLELRGGTTVKVSAPTVELAGDGNVSVEAGGILTLKGAMVKIN
jgi:uncharacterized protein involved in type VI secretion and phage assembly